MKKTCIKHTAMAMVLPLLFASCLKDTELIGPDADGSIANVIEFGNPAEPSSPRTSSIPKYSLSFNMTPSAVLNLKIKCVGAETAKEDIRVEIALDNSLIDVYNADPDNGAALAELPADRYAVTTTEAVIRKGEREAVVPIDLKPDKFTFDKDYALGFSITSASSGVISGNFGKVVLELSGKNAYDGVYAYETSANTGLQPNKSTSVSLVTVGANTVRMNLLATYSNMANYTIDPATNKIVSITGAVGTVVIDPSSHYDPATKTFHLKWTSSLGGGILIEETMTYTGPRD